MCDTRARRQVDVSLPIAAWVLRSRAYNRTMSEAPVYREYLRQIVLKEASPLHKYGHQVRLYELSNEIGLGMVYDDDVVYAAVWLHDIGVFDGNRPSNVEELEQWDHVRYATQRSREILTQCDFPPEKIPHVLTVIEEHQPKDTPHSIESTIVRDADILEQLGSIAVLRTAAKLGNDTRFLRFSDVRDHLTRQLRELPAKLNLARSRQLAVARELALNEFLMSLEAEAGDGLG